MSNNIGVISTGTTRGTGMMMIGRETKTTGVLSNLTNHHKSSSLTTYRRNGDQTTNKVDTIMSPMHGFNKHTTTRSSIMLNTRDNNTTN